MQYGLQGAGGGRMTAGIWPNGHVPEHSFMYVTVSCKFNKFCDLGLPHPTPEAGDHLSEDETESMTAHQSECTSKTLGHTNTIQYFMYRSIPLWTLQFPANLISFAI
jgi:hypothetical protein